ETSACRRKACPALDAGWVPVSRLREALAQSNRVDRCFGGRRQIGQDHAPENELNMSVTIERVETIALRIPYDHCAPKPTLAGLDIALWDLRGKLEDMPVHALLGRKKRDRVEVYASLLAYGGNVEDVKRNTTRALERGYRHIKLHEKTAETVAAARAATGPG